MTGAFFDNMKL